MSGKVRFLHEDDAAMIGANGRPLAEEILELDPGPCVVCGRTPQQGALSGMLVNTYIERGVLKGDATCQECLDEVGEPA